MTDYESISNSSAGTRLEISSALDREMGINAGIMILIDNVTCKRWNKHRAASGHGGKDTGWLWGLSSKNCCLSSPRL